MWSTWHINPSGLYAAQLIQNGISVKEACRVAICLPHSLISDIKELPDKLLRIYGAMTRR